MNKDENYTQRWCIGWNIRENSGCEEFFTREETG